MKAKDLFKEGWCMTLRPFDFADFDFYIQKLSIFYCYTYKHQYITVLSDEGKKIVEEEIEPFLNRKFALTNSTWSQYHNEPDHDYEVRVGQMHDLVISSYQRNDRYTGTIVETYFEGKTIRFYPDEYKPIGFDIAEILDEEGYIIKVDRQLKEIDPKLKDRIYYLMTRGYTENHAFKVNSFNLKELVWYKPNSALLDYFVSPSEIISPDKDYNNE